MLLATNWWAVALRGVAAIIFGILTFAFPGITLELLVLWFGVYAIFDGIFNLLAAWRHPDPAQRWWVLAIEGIVGIAAGGLTFIWPAITAVVLLFLIAVWAIVTGILEIAAAVRLRRAIAGEWLLALMGVLSVFFGFLLILAPVAGALAVVWWIGAYALLFGILMVALALRLRALTPRIGSGGVLRHA